MKQTNSSWMLVMKAVGYIQWYIYRKPKGHINNNCKFLMTLKLSLSVGVFTFHDNDIEI